MAGTAIVGVSLRPSTFAAGGSLLDDVDVTFTKIRFGLGYGGQGGGSGDDAVTLQATMVDSDGTEHQGYWSCGNGFVPSETGDEAENGKMLVPIGDKTAPNGSSNFALLINSFVNAGLPEDLLDSGDITALEGTKAHVNRVPEPKRGGGLVRTGKNADQPRTVLLVTTIISLPGEQAKAKAGTKTAAVKAAGTKVAAKAAEPEPAEQSEIGAALEGALFDIFTGLGKTEMKKMELTKAVFTGVDKADPNRAQYLKEVVKDDVLSAMTTFFTYDGKTLKLNE